MEIRDGTAYLGRLDDASPDALREVARALREQGVTNLAVEVDEGDEQTLERLGFVPVAHILSVALAVLERDLERKPRGESFGSVHAQTDDLPAVERIVKRFVPTLPGKSKGTVIVPPRNGWTSVYDELCDRDPSMVPRLARELSDAVGVVAISLAAEEGAVARYRIYDRGRMLDEYLSVREYYGPLPPGEVVSLAANPTLVERLTGADRRTVREAAVHGASPDELPPPGETIAKLAAAMGIEGGEHGYARSRELADAILIDR
ncbi:MAG: hypothetical protein H0T20_04090 [Actinobacteria bacterium]|nr:hypothetical protein [Actinomycetota bacterium]